MNTDDPSALTRLSPRVVAAAALLITLCSISAPVIAEGDGIVVQEPRIAGHDRVETAQRVAAASRLAGAAGPTVVVTPADAPPGVAAAAGAAAAILDGPLVLTADPPDPQTVATIAAGPTQEVLLIGGSTDLAQKIAAETDLPVTEVHPDGGPPAIAASVARYLVGTRDGHAPTSALLVGTQALADALAGAPLAAAWDAPMLLTAPDALDPHTRFVLGQLAFEEVVILGGDAAVGAQVAAELASEGLAVRRLAGPDRAGTALAVAAARGVPADVGGQVLLAGAAVDAAGLGALAHARSAAVLPPEPQILVWLAARCGSGTTVQAVGGVATVDAAQLAAAQRATRRCDGPRAAATIRLAVSVRGQGIQDPQGLAGLIQALATGPDGWSSRRVRLVGVAERHHVGIVVADHVDCGGAVGCIVGRDVLLDSAFVAQADERALGRAVHRLLGSWLGLPTGPCRADLLLVDAGCRDGADHPSAAERAALADLLVPTATLAFTGDVHAERHIGARIVAGDNPLAPVAGILSDADAAIVNLETPLSTRGRPAPKTFTFRGPPATAGALVDVGVDVVSLANNHALDFGYDALFDTLVAADAAGLATVGAGHDAAQAYAPWVVDTPAGRVAVVGLTRVLHTRAWEATATRAGLASAYDEPAAVAAVQAARQVADVVVVAIHWGVERADCPAASQRHLSRLLTDAGADVVVGHHPHVLQGVQTWVGSPTDAHLVAFSLGNFVWYHDRSPSNLTGVLEVELPLLDSPTWRLRPAVIGDDGSPRPVEGSTAQAIAARVAARSPGGALGCAF